MRDRAVFRWKTEVPTLLRARCGKPAFSSADSYQRNARGNEALIRRHQSEFRRLVVSILVSVLLRSTRSRCERGKARARRVSLRPKRKFGRPVRR